ncbi:MAG: 3-mercaptopyruvate sulfurtransferase [Gemmatimonadetes bacterium]|nr:3-mercaptopyruvate sulfurtransferase [Gemmatimonadota bacterium]
MTSLSTPPFMSTAELAARLGDPGVVVLDASWYMPQSGRDARAEFEAAHLPGARFFDLDQVSDPSSPLPHMLPTPAAFEAAMRALGVGRASLVVVYDGSGTNMSAPRAWWMFRYFGHAAVTVLDGGSRAWQREGHPMERGEPTVRPGDFTAGPSLEAVRTAEQVGDALAAGSAEVVDARSAGRYRGADPEPRAGLASGHMPGALNLPYAELVDANGLALPPEAVRERLAGAGLSLKAPVIASCGSGVTACVLLHALARVGHDGRALYDGSWTEWASRQLPIATGAAPR